MRKGLINRSKGGIKYDSCSGEQGRSESIKSENRLNPTVVLKRKLRKETNGKEASDNISKTTREMRWSEVECKDLRANGQEVMGCGDSRRRRCGSGGAENEDAKEA